MENWRQLVVSPGQTVGSAIAVIDSQPQKICLVVDGNGRLQGTITDGDIRRGLLRHISIDSLVTEVMNASPKVASPGAGRDALLRLAHEYKLRHIPLVDSTGLLVGLAGLADLRLLHPERANRVVLMAGGLGTRLLPLTETTPKPMIKVGDKPVLERILDSLIDQGFRHFYFSVNYMSEMVSDHFGDGSRWGVDIRYLREDKRLGTAGPLSLIDEKLDRPLVVMNGDVITRVPFNLLLDFHHDVDASATMGVREYEFQVPYGVVQMDGHRITSIDEKPVNRFFVNAGIYILDPDVVAMVPDDRFYDMPQLFEGLLAAGRSTAAFPIREYWLDIGRMDDLTRARADFAAEIDDY